jgi:hypothetical protein
MGYWQAVSASCAAKAGLACELMGLDQDRVSGAMYDVESGRHEWRVAVMIAATVEHGPGGNAPAGCLCGKCTAGMGESRD